MKTSIKKATAILTLLVLTFSLTGCSQAELDLVSLAKQAAQLEGIAVAQEVHIDLTNDTLSQALGLTLPSHLDLRVTGILDTSRDLYDLELSYRLEETGAYLPVCRAASDGTVTYVSTEGIWRLVKTYSSTPFSPEYIAEMDDYIAAHPFVRMGEDDWVLNIHFAPVALPEARDYAALVESLLPDLADYDTGLVTAIDGGCRLQASGSDWLALTDGWLTYLQTHPDAGYALSQKVTAFKEAMLSANGIKSGWPEVTLDEWQQSLQDRIDRWEKRKAAWTKPPFDAKDSFDATLQMSGSQGSRTFTGSSTLHLDQWGLSLASTTTLKETAIQGTVAFNAINGNDFDAGLKAINARYTLTTGLKLEPDTEGYATAFLMQTFCGQPSGNLNYASMHLIDGRYYIDALDLSRILPGTTVTLSGDEALITYGGQSVTLTTVPALNVVMDREEPFVPVRSLAGLGLAVDYQTPPETITLTIQ